MWRELIDGVPTTATFAPPASEESLAAAEGVLAQSFPPLLLSLLRESTGVLGDYDLGLVWSIERIVTDNLAFRSSEACRSLYMPFGALLFFGDAGNGDQFALLSPPVDRDDVFAWAHETNSRNWVAGNLQTYRGAAFFSPDTTRLPLSRHVSSHGEGRPGWSGAKLDSDVHSVSRRAGRVEN